MDNLKDLGWHHLGSEYEQTIQWQLTETQLVNPWLPQQSITFHN